jgi:hypothetical protein
VISPSKRGQAAKLLSIAIESLRSKGPSSAVRQLISTPKLLNRFGQIHPYSRKSEQLGAFHGIVHALREG